MENLYVSDLFGYNITNGSPVIIINVNKTKNMFIKVSEDIDSNTSVWKYNSSLISELLSERNVNPKNFLTIGHVLAKSNVLPDIVILANKSICMVPQGYEEVTNYSKGKIIRLFNMSSSGNKNYSAGLFYVDNVNGHNIVNILESLDSVGIIPEKLLMKYSVGDLSNVTQNKFGIDCNDFGLLSSVKIGIKTLSRNQDIAEKFKLINGDDKYLTMVGNKLIAKQSANSLAQSFSYNAQGELINEDKCLSYKDTKILAESCNPNNSNQKWVISQNKILPSNNFGKCLDVSALDKTTVELNDCDLSDSQLWNQEVETNKFDDTESAMSGDYTWTKYKGKTLALVENDNPWFINSDTVEVQSINKSSLERYDSTQFREIPDYQPNFTINLRNNSHFKSNFVIDPESPTMGYGYSFKSRSGKPCETVKFENNKLGSSSDSNSSGIEHFGDIDQSQQKYNVEQQIFMIIVLLAIILIIYKAWKSGN